jgi:TPR repeat protein
MFAHPSFLRQAGHFKVAASASLGIVLAHLLCVACGTVGPTQRSKDVAESTKPFKGIECEPGLVLECEPACGRGDMAACEIAGIGYLQGSAVNRDLGRARIMLERSCESKHALACSNYAKMAQDDQGVTLPADTQLSYLRMGCDKEDSNACYRVGKLLLDSNAELTESHRQEAARRFETACAGGESDACFALGVAAKTGALGNRDIVKASRLLTDACDGGNATACFELADLQSAPNTALTDPSKAVKNLGKACNSRVGAACAKLAGIYGHGIGVPANAAKAHTLHATACELDQAPSCYAEGQYQLERDPEAASAAFQKACDAKLANACFERAELLEGRTPGLTPDLETARALYQQACEANVPKSCTYGGLLALKLNAKAMPAEERERIVKRMQQGCSVEREPDACRHWGAWLASGEHGVKKDGAKAAEVLGPLCVKAETSEDATFACYQLGKLNEQGVGIARNVLGAGTFYQKACSAKHAPACLAYANLLWNGPQGFQKDPEAAVVVFKQQCKDTVKGSQSEACVSLANAEMVGIGTVRNLDQAKARLQIQCDAGLQSGCAYLGQYYLLQRGDESQVKRGESLLRSACDGANGPACYFLADRPTIPAAQRKELTKRACLLGVIEACEAPR